MTNSINKMAGKNSIERNVGTPSRARSSVKQRPVKVSTPPRNIVSPTQRTSPGLVAGYFAGGKWSEPPSPASLPKPPQHWTQLNFGKCPTTIDRPQKLETIKSSHQFKVLLNVQA